MRNVKRAMAGKKKRVKAEPAVMPKSKGRVINVPWYPPSAQLKKEIKRLAFDEECSMSQLITEGIAMVLEKRGKDIKDYM